jgi:hypothetical protein
MTRIGVSICFALTLLCPVFCLAEMGGECSPHASLDGDNCEAMSIGAVVEKPTTALALPDQSSPSQEGLLSPATAGRDHARRVWLAAWHAEQVKPPPSAARRHALLQVFLF